MHALALTRERLLVVEDEPLLALDLAILLKKEGATVLRASSASRALRLIETSALSAGVVDIQLGGDDAVFYTGRADAPWRR